MGKNKGNRILVTLECIECRSYLSGSDVKSHLIVARNKSSASVSRYFTQKNRRNNPDRLELKKYCIICNKSTRHKEIK